MTLRNKILLLMVVVALGCTITSCNKGGKKAASVSGMCKVICDESFKNILDDEIEVFEYTYKEGNSQVVVDAEINK